MIDSGLVLGVAMEHATEKVDMLSDLPDVLLLRILSLASLGVRTLVKTSLLSRRWRHLWREVPFLEIDPREFQEAAAATTRHSKREKRSPVKEWDRFEKFTENLLSRRSPDLPLQTLQLHVVNAPQVQGRHGRSNQGDASRLVRLCLERCRPVKLDIFSDETLVDLRGLGPEIDLTRLTTLHLSGLVLRSGFAHHLGASVCPRLNHVQLDDCELCFTELVFSRTLKSLSVFYSLGNLVDRRRGSVSRPRIEAPGLESMIVESIDGMIPDYHVPSLVGASVILLDKGSIEDEFEMLCSLHNVTRLYLSGLSSSMDKVPKFRNLRALHLEGCNLTGQLCTTLDLFMRATPNLEELTVQNCQFGLSTDHGVPYEGQLGDLRTSHNLRTLHLEQCDLATRSHGEAPTLLEYFLQSAPNLEKLTLQYCKLPGGMPGRTKSKKKMAYQCVSIKSAEIRYVKQDGVSQMVDLLLGVSKNLQRSSI